VTVCGNGPVLCSSTGGPPGRRCGWVRRRSTSWRYRATTSQASPRRTTRKGRGVSATTKVPPARSATTSRLPSNQGNLVAQGQQPDVVGPFGGEGGRAPRRGAGSDGRNPPSTRRRPHPMDGRPCDLVQQLPVQWLDRISDLNDAEPDDERINR
jgi:hypothetical protein